NQRKGFLGEFGGGNNGTCLGAIDNIVDHLEANADVYIGWTYWAAGPWWGSYFTSLEPSGGADKAQMDALEPHLGNLPPPPSCSDGVQNGNETGVDCGGSCAACSGSCSPRTYEAESMFHSTGGATTGGWNIWSNGYISTNHTFAAGSTSITVSAKGTPAGGVWPRMTLSIAGTNVGSVTVNSANFANYAFSYNASAGSKEVRVVFDNDQIIGS